MDRIILIINGKEYKALKTEKITKTVTEKTIKRGKKQYKIKSTQKIVQFYIPEGYEADLYILIPVSKDKVKEVENGKLTLL